MIFNCILSSYICLHVEKKRSILSNDTIYIICICIEYYYWIWTIKLLNFTIMWYTQLLPDVEILFNHLGKVETLRFKNTIVFDMNHRLFMEKKHFWMVLIWFANSFKWSFIISNSNKVIQSRFRINNRLPRIGAWAGYFRNFSNN